MIIWAFIVPPFKVLFGYGTVHLIRDQKSLIAHLITVVFLWGWWSQTYLGGKREMRDLWQKISNPVFFCTVHTMILNYKSADVHWMCSQNSKFKNDQKLELTFEFED